MKAYEASGITKEESSEDTVITTEEVKAEPKKNARKTTPKTMKKSTARTTVKEDKTEETVKLDKKPETEETIKVAKAEKPVKKARAEKKAKAVRTSKVEDSVKAEQKSVVNKNVSERSVGAGQTEKDTKNKTARGRKPSIKKEIFIQYYGRQIDEGALMNKVIGDCKSQNVVVKDIRLYLKPEDNTCYYVANGNVAGKVELYESV